jgi:S1-C subfamily serine protease
MADRMEELKRQHEERKRRLDGSGAPSVPGKSSQPEVLSAPQPSAKRGRWFFGLFGFGCGAAVALTLLVIAVIAFAVFASRGCRPTPAKNADMPTTSDAQKMISLGTGWVCESGLIVTACHVIDGGKEITVYFGKGRVYQAEIVETDAANDIALLRLPPNAIIPPGLPFAAVQVELGQKVFTVGFPQADLQGIEPKLNDGTVSSVKGMQDDPRHMQISVPVQPGNSGGPLLNMRGEVVGVVFSGLNALAVAAQNGHVPQNVNYAVKSDYVRTLLSTAGASQARSVLPAKDASLEEQAKRIRGSVALIVVK